MSDRNRGRVCNAGCACCDSERAPRPSRKGRRRTKRVERQEWRKEAREYMR